MSQALHWPNFLFTPVPPFSAPFPAPLIRSCNLGCCRPSALLPASAPRGLPDFGEPCSLTIPSPSARTGPAFLHRCSRNFRLDEPKTTKGKRKQRKKAKERNKGEKRKEEGILHLDKSTLPAVPDEASNNPRLRPLPRKKGPLSTKALSPCACPRLLPLLLLRGSGLRSPCPSTLLLLAASNLIATDRLPSSRPCAALSEGRKFTPFEPLLAFATHSLLVQCQHSFNSAA